jgi:Phospholipase_D-nuclease N-terminal
VEGHPDPLVALFAVEAEMSFGDFIWFLLWSYLFIAYLMVMFQIILDLFRDHELNGFAKAVWFVALIFLPVIAAIVYLIARGRHMAERQVSRMQAAQGETEQYIQTVASRSNPADQIASAKGLLDAGTITQAEFDSLKSKALA